jgi:UDP-glucose 4-epimerase
MNILVTGGAGHIGSHVVDAYINAGHRVVALDNLSTGSEQNINPAAQFHHGDIRDGTLIGKLFRHYKFDVVNHHAAQMDVRRSVREPLFDADINVMGGLRLIDTAARAGVGRFIYASTGGAVYGNPERIPVTEDDPVRPECHYGISKHTPEHYLALYQKLYGMCYVVLRYPNVYGPRQNPRGEAGVVALFIGKMLAGEQPAIYGDGSESRDYVYVGDIARANVLALAAGDNEIICLGSGIATSTKDIYAHCAEACRYAGGHSSAPLRAGEIGRISLSGSKAEKLLGWKPTMPLANGIAIVAQHLTSRP